MLTAADVEQKTFSTALRGYDLDEVDDFLDEIVTTIRELTNQLEAAQGSAPGGAVTVTPAPAPVAEPVPEPEPIRAARPEIDESAIGRALVAAQTAADNLLAEAQSEAVKIVDSAKSEADTWVAEKEAKRAEAEAEISALAARVASVRSELSVLAGEVSEKLDDMDVVITGAHTAPALELPGTTGAGDDGSTDDEGPYEIVAAEATREDDNGDGDDDGEGSDDSDEDASDTDDLDEMLNGVANDLQLGPDEKAEDTDEDE